MFRPAAIVTLGIVGLGLAGCAGSPPPTTYDIVASRSFAASPKSAKYQLVVSEPVAATPLVRQAVVDYWAAQQR